MVAEGGEGGEATSQSGPDRPWPGTALGLFDGRATTRLT